MERKAFGFLQRWATKKMRKPLVLRGARQVGKSTLVRLFCKKNNYDLLEINLEEKTLPEFEKEVNFSLERLLAEIEVVAKKKIGSNSIIFIDEIQEQKLALQRLRFFKEQRPEIMVIAAGSLLEKIVTEEEYRSPVGRIENFHLGPMTFSEFLKALDQDILLEYINKAHQQPITTLAHEELIEYLKLFYYIGGMPEAILAYKEDKSYLSVQEIHRSIIETYIEDIPKYSKGKGNLRVEEAFRYAGRDYGQKVVYTHISEANSRDIKKSINILKKIKMIYPCYHTNASGLPIESQVDESVLKLFFLDIGLSNFMLKTEAVDIMRLNENSLLTKGKIAEQFVAQHLAFLRQGVEEPSLYYWLRDKRKNKAEIDFIISYASHIFPIEVKSGASGSMRSLWLFLQEKKMDYGIRFDLLYRDNYLSKYSDKKASILNLPLYLVERVEDFLAT